MGSRCASSQQFEIDVFLRHLVDERVARDGDEAKMTEQFFVAVSMLVTCYVRLKMDTDLFISF